ncbi:hypothetical protein ACFU5O_13595 [Streptomyces sp. NPDC057445]|uniref:hypothetical protein n=1 Tax=Streptomyces sp. NPDC057445 TaxID=3346136 RepID=UPI0036C6653F
MTSLRRLPWGLAVAKDRRYARDRRSGRLRGRRHRRILAHRSIEFVQSPAPGRERSQCLLLVHIRKVVGQVGYQVCDRCAEGVITEVVIEEPFHDSGLGTRALSHLRARYPGVAWRSTLERRRTRDLLRRMRVPVATSGPVCSHAEPAAAPRAGR